ncbi:MAG: SpoIIE family protein phosphatase, partial [Acidimicrobiales bacterium]
ERAAFEARLGRPIIDRPSDVTVPSPARPVHYAVQAVVPRSAAFEALLGFDLRSDPVRRGAAEAARDAGGVVLSEPVPSVATGSRSFFVIQPIYRLGGPFDTVSERRANLVGFVSTAFESAGLADVIANALPEGSSFSLRDRGDLLSASEPAPTKGAERTIDAANRRWTLVVDTAAAPDHTVALLLGMLTLLVGGGLAYELARTARHTRDLRRSSELMARTAALAEALTGARTVDDVAAVIEAQLPEALGVRSASVGIVDQEAGVLDIRYPPSVDPATAARYGTVRLDAPVPIAAAVRSGEMVVLRTLADWAAQAPPEVVHDVRAMGLVSTICVPLDGSDGRVVAALGMAWSGVATIDDQVLSTVATVAEICAYALGRARATDEATRRAEQLALLAEQLAGATSVEEVATIVTTLGRKPVEAAATSVGLVDGADLQVAHGDTVPDEYRLERSRLPLDAPLAFTTAARTGQAMLFEDHASYVRGFPDAGGPVAGARAALPLRRPDGVTIGAIVHLWNGDRRFDEALRSTLRTIADLTGQALERARLGVLKADDARHTEALAELTEGLARSRSSADVMRFLARGVLAPLDAVHAAVAVIEGDQIHRHYTPGARTDVIARLQDPSVALDSATPLAEAARTGVPVLLPDLAVARERYPSLVDGWTRLGFQAMANLPLRDRRGDLLGALGLAWASPTDLDSMRDRLATIAGIAGQTLDRALLSDAEHRLVTTFQSGLLTPLPPHPCLATAARYLPAAQAVGMGGDWYEGIVLPDGRYVVVVGDVSGHGITAVGQMAQLRSVIGAMASLDLPVGEVFARTSALPHQGDPVFATAALLEIDPGAHVVRYACAGHPPPLVRLPDGQVVALDGGRQPLLGLPIDGCRAGQQDLPPGAVLVAYTDGLIERRDEPIDASILRLAAELEQVEAADPEVVADALLERCLDGREPDDDVALAVVVHRP